MISLTRKEANILFKLHDNIEYSQDEKGRPLPVSSKFRYAINYNIQKLERIINESASVLSIDPETMEKYREYEKQMKLLQDKFVPNGKSPNDLTQTEKDELAKQTSNCLTSHSKEISKVAEVKKLYDSKLEERIEIELRSINLSWIPDLSNNKSNDSFMYLMQEKGLLIEDSVFNQSIDTKSVESSETFGKIGN